MTSRSAPWSEPTYLRPSATSFLLALGALAGLVAAARLAEVDPARLVEPRSLTNMAELARGLLRPALSPEFLRVLAPAILETLMIAVVALVLAVAAAVPLALAGTRLLVHTRAAEARYVAVRALLAALRAIPELVWALLFIRMGAGLGPLAAILALAAVYGGMLGKVYSELLDAVPRAPLEALRALGAGSTALVAYAALPLAFPALASYTLYRFECALRAAAVLGLVGAGGLGLQLELSLKMFAYDEVATILLATLLLVALVDRASARLRRVLE